jgi:hypothetical protein
MQNTLKRAGLAVMLVGLVGVAPSIAQQSPAPAPAPREPEQQRAKDPAPVSGELVSLDAKARTLVIKTDSGNEMSFSYTDTTEIVGADKGASGLATMNGSAVTVHYSVHGTANTATKIEVTKK